MHYGGGHTICVGYVWLLVWFGLGWVHLIAM